MSDAEITIGNMCSEDCAQVYAIENFCFSDSSWKQEDFAAALSAPEQYYVVAKTMGRVVGFGALYIMVDCGDLVNIAVHPDWQGRGIAHMLMQALLAEGANRGLTCITLEVRMSNEAAIHLYEKYGFQNISIRKQYYRNPIEDACIMQKEL